MKYLALNVDQPLFHLLYNKHPFYLKVIIEIRYSVYFAF